MSASGSVTRGARRPSPDTDLKSIKEKPLLSHLGVTRASGEPELVDWHPSGGGPSLAGSPDVG